MNYCSNEQWKLLELKKTANLPPLYSDANNQKDAGRVAKVNAALGKWKEEVEEVTFESKV